MPMKAMPQRQQCGIDQAFEPGPVGRLQSGAEGRELEHRGNGIGAGSHR